MKRRDVLKAGLGSLVAGTLTVGFEAGTASVSAGTSVAKADPKCWTDASDVVWTSPSKNASGAMPLGNGEVGISLWVEEGGDLLFYISRSDAFSETARLLKVGQVRIALSPNPFAAGAPFRQTLRLSNGVCEITAGVGQQAVALKIFVDSEQPVVHCMGTTFSPISVTATVESWRTEAHTLTDGDEMLSAWHLKGAPFPIVESADLFPHAAAGSVAWYHRNETSPAYTASLKTQSLETAVDVAPDPLLHRTFGGWLAGPGLTVTDARTLKSVKPTNSFSLRVAAPCLQTKMASDWLSAAAHAAAQSQDANAVLQRTTAWWRAYWDRSWVVVSGDRAIKIPGGNHPLRIGYDSHRLNTFPGEIGRASVYGRSLSEAEIVQLAVADRTQLVPVQTGLFVHGDGTPREIADSALDFRHGFTLEAWIKTDGSRDGRIFDKLTAGERDGFLLDIHPKDALRFIFGSRELQTPTGVLTADWHHVAATVDADSGAARLFLDGKRVGEWGGNDAQSPITQGYTLQRYMQACGGRGNYPIKFNGGIFTVEPIAEGESLNADWRRWGEAHWFQNVRHMYHPMLAGGDFEMMDPFFRLYKTVRPLAEARTRLYHGVSGCYFPETMTVWGTYANSDYGWDRTGKQPKEVDSPWWRYAWNQGPELVALMLDRWDYTQDTAFLKQTLLPMAVSVLTYFDTRFSKDATGRIRLDPTQAVETLWTDVINDMPSTAGLNDICARLCTLPEQQIMPTQRAFFARLKAAVPEIPLEEVVVDGVKRRTLAPAQAYDPKRTNCENPELYAIWPFRLYGVGRPDLEFARTAYARRVNHLDVGWGYDGNCAALLGLTDEAARILQAKCANTNANHRWPATWGPNFDWLPDQNHGGNLLETTHLMLLQSAGDRIRLLPAWPKEWDVSFRLRAPRKTLIECVYRGGTIEHLQVTPQSRRADIVFPD